MKDRIEEIFQQVMNESCPDPLRRFAELVAQDAVEKEREDCAKLIERMSDATWTFCNFAEAIRQRGEK